MKNYCQQKLLKSVLHYFYTPWGFSSGTKLKLVTSWSPVHYGSFAQITSPVYSFMLQSLIYGVIMITFLI